jgi:hypothetical protein
VDGITLREHRHFIYAASGTHYGVNINRYGAWPTIPEQDVIGVAPGAMLQTATASHML